MKKLLIFLLVSFPLATMAQRLISSETVIEPDKSYGLGGTKTITIKQHMVKLASGDSGVVETKTVTFKDSKGRAWEERDTFINKTTMVKTIVEDNFDEKGRLIHVKSTMVDAAAQPIEFYEKKYKDGEKIYGYMEYGTGAKEIYDPKTGKTIKIPAPIQEPPKKDEPPVEKPKYDLVPDLTPSTYTDIDYTPPTDKISLAPAILHFGDKSMHYLSFGITGSYTHYLNSHLGLSLNAGLFNHKTSGGNATESHSQIFNLYNYTAGVDLIPGKEQINHFGFDAHAYAGLTTYTIKDKTSGYGTYSNSYHSFTADAGIEEFYETMYWHFAIQLAYAPTFLFNTTQNNIRLALIAGYLIGSHGKKN